MITPASPPFDREKLLVFALQCIHSGISIVPVGSDKKPTLIEWKWLQTQIPDEATVRSWFEDPRVTGIAAVCGKISGGLMVLDFDYLRSYEAWRKVIGNAADGQPLQLTGSREGYQLLMRCDDPGPNQELAFYVKEDAKTGRSVAIETRGEGGYAILPPSLHPTGNLYEWVDGDVGTIPRLSMPTVRMFLNEARLLNEAPQTRQQLERARAAKTKSRSIVNGDGSVIGQWNQRIGIRDILIRAGYTPFRERFTRPGDDASPGSVVIIDEKRSYHWSSNDALHDGHAHDAFSVMCEVEHHGDVSAAVKAAARELGLPKAPHRHVKPRLNMNVVSQYRPFPVDALPPVPRQFVQAAASAIGCDPAYVALHVLGVLAGCIGNCLRVLLKNGWSEPCVLWLVTIGESGSLKSPGFRLAVAPLRKAQVKAIQDHKDAMVKYEGEQARYELAMREWKKEGGKTDPPLSPEPPPALRFIVSDVTVEAIAPLLRANPRGLTLGRDELAAWVCGFDRYSSGGKGADAPAWLSMYDADSLTVDRKGGDKTIYVPAAAVSVVGTIQPGILCRVFTCDHRASGLLARLMLAMPPNQPAVWSDAELPVKVEQAFASLVDALLNLTPGVDEDGAPRPRFIPLSDTARTAFIQWHDQHAVELADLTGDLAAAYSKIKGVCARLALVIHAVKVACYEPDTNPALIDEASVVSAIAMAQWFKHEAGRVYAVLGESDEQRDQRKLLEWIRQHGGRATVRDLTRGPRQFRGDSDLAEAQLSNLVNAGYGRWHDTGDDDGGRPTRAFVLDEGDAMQGGDETPKNPGNGEVPSPSPLPEGEENADA